MANNNQRGYRSLFWPIVLISIGVVWLLANAGLFGFENLMVLFQLWPIILIAIGLDLLVGRASAAIGALIGIATVAILIGLMLMGPSLGLVQTADVQSANIVEPLAGANSATVTLNLAVGDVTIDALDDSNNLMVADINYLGVLDFQSSGDSNRTITLDTNNEIGATVNTWPFNNLFPSDNEASLKWDVAFNPNVPLSLDIRGGVGDSTVNLADLDLTTLDIDAGVGNMNIGLPGGSYEVQMSGGVGSFDIAVAEDADITLQTSGGVGTTTIDVPNNAAVRVEGSGGLGGLNLPSNMTLITESGDTEIWETAGFDSASNQIVIRHSGGVGGLTVR